MTLATRRVAWATSADLAGFTHTDTHPQELERAGRFKSALRRQQYLATRAMLRALLADHTGRPAASFELTADERGKPVCAGGPAISISHSGDTVACALADTGEIGIDVEFPGRSRDISGIAERFFSAREAAWLATQPPDRFYMLWVLKEAWLKAAGTGIAGGLDTLRCTVTPPQIEPLPGSAPFAVLQLYALGDEFLGVAALEAPPAVTRVDRWLPAQNAFVDDDHPELLASSSGA